MVGIIHFRKAGHFRPFICVTIERSEMIIGGDLLFGNEQEITSILFKLQLK